MNVQQLHRALGALIEKGHGRKPVVIDKPTFTHPLETDGVVMLDVEGYECPVWIPILDDDGGTKLNKDGSESGKKVAVLFGDARETDHD